MLSKYIFWFGIAVVIGIILTVLSGCTYGTYNNNEPGSYPNQHNTDNCSQPKG